MHVEQHRLKSEIEPTMFVALTVQVVELVVVSVIQGCLFLKQFFHTVQLK